MKKIGEYTILEKLDETGKSVVYRGRKEGENGTVIIKILESEYPSLSEIARFRQEYDLIRNIDLEGVVKTLDLIEDNNTFALILEDFEGLAVKRLINTEIIDIKTFLDIGIKLSGILGNLHKENIIHKDIKPGNILFNPTNGMVKIADFGISSILTRENEEIYNPNIIEGTMVYMSPEQTGRMNRIVDYRTDFYSLGVTFYEMLTGKVPFEAGDPMELIHSHIAREPAAPAEVNPSIPKMISDIVMKLMAKPAGERYQNGFGLMADLQECLRQLGSKGEIGFFDLAGKDISIRFNIPQKLFGREKEIEILLSAFEQAAKGGSGILVVSGYPGIGKSVLINEIQKPVTGGRGYFLPGKFEQFKRDMPYSSIIQAFRVLVRQILSEGKERIDAWKEELLEVLGPNGKVITSVIPEVELITGEQEDIPLLGLEESRNRFNFVFKNFIRVFAKEEHPLVIFLDDLQWADAASLDIIKLLMVDTDTRHLLFIGAYRDNEVSEFHSLSIIMEEIRAGGVPIESISLPPLQITDVNRHVSNFLRCGEDRSLPLAESVYKKTQGNPFFINQFLRILHDEKILKIDPVSGWDWDMEQVNSMQVTDNVVELMTGKIEKLPGVTRELLMICSCMGNRFDLETVSLVTDEPVDSVLSELFPAVSEGMVYFQGDIYRFQHDRVEEAVYSLISGEEKSKLHYRIGNLLLEKTKKEKEDLEDKILDIVNQLNSGKDLISSEEEKYRLAELNLLAGKKSKASAAYESALNLLKTGIELIYSGEDNESSCWKNRYGLILPLYTEAAEAAYLNVDYDEMNRLSEVVLKQAVSIPDKIRIYETRIRAFMGQNKLLEAVNTALEALRAMGVTFPGKPKKFHVLISFLKTKLALLGKEPEDLIDLPVMKDPYLQAKMRLMSMASPAAYWTDQNLLVLLAFELVIVSVKHGNFSDSPYSYAVFGFILITLGDIDKGYRLGKMALRLAEKMNLKDQKPRINFVFNTFIRHWKEPAMETIDSLVETYRMAIETGDLEFAGHSAMVLCYSLYLVSFNLDQVDREIQKYSLATAKIKQETNANMINLTHQAVLNLAGKSGYTYRLTGEAYDEREMLPTHIAAKDRTALANFYYTKAFLCYIFGEYLSAFENCEEAEKVADAMAGILSVHIYYFFASLTELALYTDKLTRKEKRSIFRKVKRNQEMIKKWAAFAPENHLHKYNLVEAEIARVKGDDNKAKKLYEISIKGARENGYTRDEAVAYEAAAKFYLEEGYNDFASLYMTRACFAYSRWGAFAKVKNLEEKYPDLLLKTPGRFHKGNRDSMVSNTSGQSVSEALDLSTVIKLSQALSDEFDLGRLLEKIIKIAIENAGARKGFLILENDKDHAFYIEARGIVDGEIKVLESIPVEGSSQLSPAIVNYVNKTKESVILDKACEKGMFTSDPYIVTNRSKSVLCTPAMYKGKISGILYLENELTAKVFIPERFELLRILFTQAAISIENARLLSHRENAAKLEREIEIAADIQAGLLPENPNIKGFEIAAYMLSADDVGGDYYDVINEAGRDWLFIGDASGHGIPAGLMMIMVQTAIHVALSQNPQLTPSELLAIINRTITENIKRLDDGKFMTLTVLAVHEAGKFIFSGLHEYIFIFRAETGRVDRIETEGTWIGLMNDISDMVDDNPLVLDIGDTMLFYTDGITEAWKKGSIQDHRDPETDMFGKERLEEIFRKLGNQAPGIIKDGILEELQDYCLSDDITLLVIRRQE